MFIEYKYTFNHGKYILHIYTTTLFTRFLEALASNWSQISWQISKWSGNRFLD